ncbi:hypothetical protein RhiJN_14969 [Ceratobasidium sp. AG-Ba]|nr:hypothetical protein RhiJN_02612 [Ceratobasidium sp. AG-Ba]QRV82305.1 hypothetical protein RhiJN_10320 [Ceratobasidium sp. AG-Ba]QRV82309.1 hypothetical protein RhiJN_10324 [Ceratobasidium sp. AG-Ba]QRV86951.1 hypothetical protein RhiJN_14969 [Ceratobasidium sp. AG-Ba]QRW06989.1 hypothetical protein RhiLY_05988 [Ceratobasidium sp. AG-Ba]
MSWSWCRVSSAGLTNCQLSSPLNDYRSRPTRSTSNKPSRSTAGATVRSDGPSPPLTRLSLVRRHERLRAADGTATHRPRHGTGAPLSSQPPPLHDLDRTYRRSEHDARSYECCARASDCATAPPIVNDTEQYRESRPRVPWRCLMRQMR